MKIWLRGNIYTIDNDILVVYLEDKDKENIKNMHPDCKIYSEFNEKIFLISKTKELLLKIRKEIEK